MELKANGLSVNEVSRCLSKSINTSIMIAVVSTHLILLVFIHTSKNGYLI